MADLQEIINTHGRALTRVAAAYEADPSLQEDLLQDILIAIHGALPALKDENRGRQPRRAARGRQKAPSGGDEPVVPTPEQAMLASERSAQLVAAVRRLPLPYRQVMMLVLEELSHAEIAEVLGLSVSNVAVRVNRAKAQLRAMLDHE